MATCLIASTAQAAAPAWAPVAGSGPTNLPPVQSEIQRVSVDAEGGDYTLTAATALGSGELSFASGFGFFDGGETQITAFASGGSSGAFAVGQTISGPGIAPGTTIVAIGSGTVTLSAPTEFSAGFGAPLTAASKVVTGVSTSAGAFAVGQTISGPGIAPGTTIVAIGSGTITLSADPTQAGVKTLTVTETTAPIDFDAEDSEVEAKLNALSGLDVTVKGGPGGKGAKSPYFVAFGGSHADVDLPQMSADGSGLSGGNNHTVLVSTVLDGGPGTTDIAIYAQNVGGIPSTGTTTLSFDLPAGVTTTETPEGADDGLGGGPPWDCLPTGAGQGSVTCTSNLVAQPGFTLPPLVAPVVAGPGAASGTVHVEVSGGGTVGTATHDMPLVVSALPSPPGLQAFSAAAYKDDGTIDTRAGAHPYSASAGLLVNTVRSSRTGEPVPAGEFRDIVVETPPGFLGNPIAAAACPETAEYALGHNGCSHASIVATAQIPLDRFGVQGEFSPVNNIQAPFGYPAKFKFLTGSGQILVNVAAGIRSDEDYGITVGSFNTPQIKPVYGSFFTFWGAPADPGHDGQRCKEFFGQEALECGPGGDKVAFLSNPTDCAEEARSQPVVRVNVNTWQSPGLFFGGNLPLKPVIGCEKLDFDADFTFEPSDTKSDSPASFRTELSVPSEGLTNPDKLMTPTINESVVELPKGVVLNASAADGLGACSKQQIGLKGTNFPLPNRIRFTKDPQTCPDASKIGSGEVKSELIEEPLHGALYLAAQGDGNPFGSLFAIYLVIEDPRHGIFIKLPGEVRVDESDGQQRIVFRDLPQLPFTYLRLNLKGGSRSPLASPTTCGTYITNAINTPWSAPESGPPTVSANGFEINQGPNGQPCANTPQERPFDLALNAGTDSTKAGAHTPLTFQITRPDGSQELNTLDLGTAPGLVASLKGIPQCAASNAEVEAKTGQQEQASSSCPAASQIGRTLTGAGSGPSPFYSAGKLYLAGPYKGAPLSVIAITPAVAGPFDLGNVVVRTALFVNRQSAQVTAKTDPIPQILEGVPLRIKDVRVILDRDNFSLNPTSCAASAITVHATGNSGAAKDLSSRFQVGGCKDLAFKPKLSAKLTGGTKRGDHPAFTAELNYPPGPGYANIKDVQVTLPHSEFLDQAHINTICTRIQAAANACPPGAIYGFAEATTPLLDGKLTGPVFLKSSDHQLPDLAISLKGPDSQPVEVEFQGRIDSIKAQIRNTIEGLPDVPVTKFVLKMKGGRKGLLVNSRNLCKGKVTRMTVKMVGQNNRQSESRPPLTRKCKGKAGKAKPAAKGQKRGG